jgi:hypothetical protein
VLCASLLLAQQPAVVRNLLHTDAQDLSLQPDLLLAGSSAQVEIVAVATTLGYLYR